MLFYRQKTPGQETSHTDGSKSDDMYPKLVKEKRNEKVL